MSQELRVFIASSSEEIAVAQQVKAALDSPADGVVCQVWNEGVFTFSKAYIESLEEELDRADFAIAILTGHDAAVVRYKETNLPRDNVILELGLFMGRLGRPRCFFFVDGDSKTKIASDLSGVKPVEFYAKPDPKKGNQRSLAEQALTVRTEILQLKTRYKPTQSIREQQDALWQFAGRIEGHWWERMRSGEDDSSALSYVTISMDETTNAPKLAGVAYDEHGKKLAWWKSIISGVYPGDQWQLFYRWEGEHEAQVGQRYGGGGRIKFDDDSLQTASGRFYDTNFAKLPEETTTRVKRFGLYRCTPDDVETMRTPWTKEAESLIHTRREELSGR